MPVAEIDPLLDQALDGRRLLAHPFYRRWEAGLVRREELAHYAAQYRHFEAALPTFLAELEAALPDGRARRLVAANLDDELGDPVPHLELLGRFAEAVGATAEPPTPATGSLLATHADLLSESAASALAGFLAYESQAAEVAVSKADGLRRHYGLDDEAVSFWEHHGEVDRRHGDWLRDALADVLDDPGRAFDDARRAADAWWAFLDEREAAAPAV